MGAVYPHRCLGHVFLDSLHFSLEGGYLNDEDLLVQHIEVYECLGGLVGRLVVCLGQVSCTPPYYSGCAVTI